MRYTPVATCVRFKYSTSLVTEANSLFPWNVSVGNREIEKGVCHCRTLSAPNISVIPDLVRDPWDITVLWVPACASLGRDDNLVRWQELMRAIRPQNKNYTGHQWDGREAGLNIASTELVPMKLDSCLRCIPLIEGGVRNDDTTRVHVRVQIPRYA